MGRGAVFKDSQLQLSNSETCSYIYSFFMQLAAKLGVALDGIDTKKRR